MHTVSLVFLSDHRCIPLAPPRTHQVIEHRHGADAGATAKAAGSAAKDGVKAGFNVAKIGPRGVVKGAAKAAGKELIADSA